MSNVSKQEFLAYVDSQWNSNDDIVESMKIIYQKKDESAAVRLVNTILESVFGIFSTPTNILKDLWRAIVAFLFRSDQDR